MQVSDQGDYLLVVSENGMGKRTELSEFKPQGRGGKGILCYKLTEKTGTIVGAKLCSDEGDIMLITNEGIIMRTPISSISVIGRNTQGVRIMNVDTEHDVRVASIAKVRSEDAEDLDPEEEASDQEFEEGSEE